jgi:hypothetical protein
MPSGGSNKDLSMAQTLDELFAAATNQVEQSSAEKWEWPENGAEYELFVAKIPDCDDPPLFQYLPIDLEHLFSEIMTGHYMTGDLFPQEQIIEEPGLWKVKIRYTVEWYTDWETGSKEPEFMLEVLEKEKI